MQVSNVIRQGISAELKAPGDEVFLIYDEFFQAEFCLELRAELARHFGWRHKNWTSRHLHNNEPRGILVDRAVDKVEALICSMCSEVQLISYWALLYRGDEKPKFHADNAKYTLTVWLTEDSYNLAPEKGGLLIINRLRPKDMPPHQFLGSKVEECMEWKDDNLVRIPYRFNRAVFFDSRYFHRSDDFSFDTSSPNGWRMNLTFAFDNAADFDARMDEYGELLLSTSKDK